MAAVAVAVVLASTLILGETRNVSKTWAHFERVTTAKADLLAQIRGALGYGGLIHRYKNFILRQDRRLIVDAQASMLDLSVALTAYKALGVNGRETAAISDLEKTLLAYLDAVATAERLASRGGMIEEINRIVEIDDRVALRALAVLDEEVGQDRRKRSDSVYRSADRVTVVTTASMFAVGTLVLVFAAGFIWFNRIRLVSPLLALGARMQSLSRSELEASVPFLDRADEIGDMARTVEVFKDNMIRRRRAEEDLREHQRDLEDRVRERTRELSERIEWHRRTEAALEESRSRLESILDITPEAVIVADEDMTVRLFNKGAERIFGYRAGEVVGRDLAMLMPERFRAPTGPRCGNSTGRAASTG